MEKKRLIYLPLILLTIFLGLLSRKIPQLPFVMGDVLYAVMIYWIWRFTLYRQTLLISCILAISFCLCIELLQLVQHPLLQMARNHSLLRLIFGQGFLWTDLVAYFIGALTAFQLDKILFCNKKNT